MSGCSRPAEKDSVPVSGKGQDAEGQAEDMPKAVNFNRELDDYQPLKKEYNFYLTYKVIHPWWDAVAIGIEDAAK